MNEIEAYAKPKKGIGMLLNTYIGATVQKSISLPASISIRSTIPKKLCKKFS